MATRSTPFWSFLISCSGALVLISCGSGSRSPLSLAPGLDPPQVSAAVTTVPAGQIQIQAIAPWPLPDRIQLQSITFVALPGSDLANRTYIADLVDAFTSFDLNKPLTLANHPEATLSIQVHSIETANLLFLNDFPAVTFDDFVLAFALSQLPVSLRDPDNITSLANDLFQSRDLEYAPEDLDPVPDATNTDFVTGGTPSPDLNDVAAIYAALQLPAALRTPENLALVINAVTDGTLTATDIIAIPGAAPQTTVTLVNTSLDGTTPDDGLCTLREAIDSTDTGSCGTEQGVIQFDPDTLAGATITLNSTLQIERDVEIQGLPDNRIAIDGNQSVLIFSILSGTVTIDNLNIVDGYGIGAFPYGPFVGGILNNGILTVNNSTISGNGGYYGGGIINFNTMTVNNSTITGNLSFRVGGISNDPGASLVVNNSTISGNVAAQGDGGLRNFGNTTVNNSTISGNLGRGVSNNGTMVINNSTISGNVDSYGGGGIENDFNSTLTINNSTISNNLVLGDFAAGLYNDGTLTISNSTLSGNVPAGLASDFGELSASNTLIVNSVGPNCSNSLLDATNLSDDNSCGSAQVDASAGEVTVFGSLDANGTTIVTGDPNGTLTPLQTHALLTGHPAIDAGDTTLIPPDEADQDTDGDTTEPVPFDQRGTGFDRVLGISVDIGAFEFSP